MGLFKKKTVTKAYDKENKKPVIKASICNGEQVAGFKNIHTGKIEEVKAISVIQEEIANSKSRLSGVIGHVCDQQKRCK